MESLFNRRFVGRVGMRHAAVILAFCLPLSLWANKDAAKGIPPKEVQKAESQKSAEPKKANEPENWALPFPVVGICIWSPVCITDHEVFKVAQLNVLYGRSRGFLGLQAGLFNETKGPTLIQAGVWNEGTTESAFSLIQIGLANRLGNPNTETLIFEAGDPETLDKINSPWSMLQFSLFGNRGNAKVVGLQLGGLWANQADSIYGIQFAWIANAATRRTVGLQFAIGVNVTGDLYGLQFATSNLANHVAGIQLGGISGARTTSGLQWGGFFAASEQVRGVQVSVWFANVSQEVRGIQLAVGVSNNSGTLYGLQTGLVTLNRRNRGLQLGGWNHTTEDALAQVGLVNTTGVGTTGLQIGAVNVSQGKSRVQIGLVNYAARNFLPIMPLVNLDFGASVPSDTDKEMAKAAGTESSGPGGSPGPGGKSAAPEAKTKSNPR